MSGSYEEVRAAVCALPRVEQLRLAEELRGRLMIDLDTWTEEEVRVELERRWEEVKSGRVKLIPGSEVLGRMRRELADAGRLQKGSGHRA